MPKSKIQDESELMRWFAEGRTYQWMTEEYLRKYGIETGPSMFGNFRRRRGLDRRIARDDDLIPWEVKREHRYDYPIMNLRAEARRRAGFEIPEHVATQVDAWIAGMDRDGVVLHYDPDTEEGWFYVPRREGVDLDLIHHPLRKTTHMRNADIA